MKLSVSPSQKKDREAELLRFCRPYMRPIRSEREVNTMSENIRNNENATSHPIFTIEEREAMCTRLYAVYEVFSQNAAKIESLQEEIERIQSESKKLDDSICQVERAYGIIYDLEHDKYRLVTDNDFTQK